MMKLYVASDIHLEFKDCNITNKDQVDVLVLSGDVLVARDLGSMDPATQEESALSQYCRRFLQQVSQEFPQVIYVMGNHEHYRGDFAKTQATIQRLLDEEHIANIHLMEKDTVTINGWKFIGGTLWTDFNKSDSLTMFHAKTAMQDYRGVRNTAAPGVWKFLPKHALDDHFRMRNYIREVIRNRRESGDTSPRVIVVGHHAPSSMSVAPWYQGDHTMNGCYYSDLSELILDHPEIVLWTHGHTHEDFDYMIGSCRVVCNPRGYAGYEIRANDWQPKLIELE